jgi:hypothetical protein
MRQFDAMESGEPIEASFTVTSGAFEGPEAPTRAVRGDLLAAVDVGNPRAVRRRYA